VIEFKPYEAKPVTRCAFQLTNKMEWAKIEEATYMVMESGEHTQALIRFKAYEEPKVGDWIVRLTQEDTYHCTDAVFRERNVVPE
jgi:hypothetical protein